MPEFETLNATNMNMLEVLVGELVRHNILKVMDLTCLIDLPTLLLNSPIGMIMNMIKRFIMSTHSYNQEGALLNGSIHARDIVRRM